jgi:hypothetical protein
MTISEKVKGYFSSSIAKCLIYEVDAEDPTAQQKLVGYFVSDSDDDSKFFIRESDMEALLLDFENDVSALETEVQRLDLLVDEKISTALDWMESVLKDVNDSFNEDSDYRPDIKDIMRDFKRDMKR